MESVKVEGVFFFFFFFRELHYREIRILHGNKKKKKKKNYLDKYSLCHCKKLVSQRVQQITEYQLGRLKKRTG